jgi:hypothetical protein
LIAAPPYPINYFDIHILTNASTMFHFKRNSSPIVLLLLLISTILFLAYSSSHGNELKNVIDEEEDKKNKSSSSSWWSWPAKFKCSCFSCPRSDDYSPECLDAITPPWPICLRHSSEEWVNIAIDSIPRCCGDDLTNCKCPMKDSQYFLNRIDDYCDGADICSKEISHPWKRYNRRT